MSKKEVMNLELSERPMLDVSVAAERITVLPVEPGGVTRVELEARRHSDGPLLKLERQGDVLLVRGAGTGWSWTGGELKRMTFFVPEHVRARVVQEFGQLIVQNLAGCDLDVSCNAGTVDLEHVRGRLKIVVDSGTVRGERVGGTFDVVSQAGSVKLAIDSLDAGEHRVRTAMGSVKLLLAPSVKVKLEAHTSLGSARLAHPSTPDAAAVMQLSADLGSIKVKTGDEQEDARHGDWPDWRRLWRDVAHTVATAIEDSLPESDEAFVRPQAKTAPSPRVPEAELRKVLELVESGKLTAPDAERLIRAMGA
ncbi:MAG: hypothetical protein U0228_31995 [Myxococcaceae bacterium]